MLRVVCTSGVKVAGLLAQVAMRTPGFSGADLANLLNEAAILTGRRNLPGISNKVRAGCGNSPCVEDDRRRALHSNAERRAREV